MIIKIEDAPAVRHIKIDIDFTDDGQAVTTIVKDEQPYNSPAVSASPGTPLVNRDTSLNLDEDFTQPEQDEDIVMPEIVEEVREANVASEMNDMEI